MAILEAIKKRYSCRSYQEKEIEKEKLNEVLEAARLAPSAKNMQEWRFVVVTDKEKKHQLAVAANNQMFIEKASAIIIACCIGEYTMRCGQSAGPIDVSIALEHMALQASELGLATCWIGAYRDEEVMNILELPEWDRPIAIIPIGFPGEHPPPPHRIGIETITFLDKYGNKWRINE